MLENTWVYVDYNNRGYKKAERSIDMTDTGQAVIPIFKRCVEAIREILSMTNQPIADQMNNIRLIEDDAFDFEFLSRLAERESWRKKEAVPSPVIWFLTITK